MCGSCLSRKIYKLTKQEMLWMEIYPQQLKFQVESHNKCKPGSKKRLKIRPITAPWIHNGVIKPSKLTKAIQDIEMAIRRRRGRMNGKPAVQQ
jgi:hypothetical protein